MNLGEKGEPQSSSVHNGVVARPGGDGVRRPRDDEYAAEAVSKRRRLILGRSGAPRSFTRLMQTDNADEEDGEKKSGRDERESCVVVVRSRARLSADPKVVRTRTAGPVWLGSDASRPPPLILHFPLLRKAHGETPFD